MDILEAAKEPVAGSFDLDASQVAHRSTVSNDGRVTLDSTPSSRRRIQIHSRRVSEQFTPRLSMSPVATSIAAVIKPV